MRYLRAFAGVVGASGSVIAAGGIVLAILSTGLAFHGWPGLRAQGEGRVGATELADVAAARQGATIQRTAAVTTLPAVPVARRSWLPVVEST